MRGDGDRTAGGSSGRTAGGGSSTAGGGASKNLGGGESRTAGGGGRRGLGGGGSRAAGGGGRRGDGDGGRNAGAGGRGGLDGGGSRNPGEGEGGGGEAVKGLRRLVPRPRRAPKAPPPEGLAGLEGMEGHRPSPPHLAGSHELGPSGSEPDWWRLDSSPFGLADSVPGFVGGVEIPEILKPPPAPDDPVRPAKDGSAKGDAVDGPLDADEFGEADEAEGRRWWRPRLGGGEGVRFANPLLLCAAALLLVGAVLGSLPALGGGWLIAYLSRRLTRAEAKWAVFGMPGLAVAAGLAWLWGRTDGRWGEPVREGHMSDAIAGTWPWVVRGAAVASALFLVWRSQRRRL
ncbi:hypothetical protein ABZ383_31125 [Streptomyces sp. NPDC005900]|uniref:hypothetical protein n=1 Tax=Streptomyces sp. NPDC005900 TaxID=3154569 RepID=UPI0033E5BB31